MALAEREINKPKVVTYEEYLAEGETLGRYEIVDGVRQYMTNPASVHQLIMRNLNRILESYEDESGTGIALMAPCDVVVARDTLQVRRPDLLYISFERWGDREFSDPSALEAPPELVVEILSPSEYRRQIDLKTAQYASAGVLECWLVSPEAETIEVLDLGADGVTRTGIFAPGDVFRSLVFPDLEVTVSQVFKLPRLPRTQSQT